jgi:hypothetical protein
LRAYWDGLQRDLGVSIQKDVLDPLGRRLIVHDDPPHPLGLELLCTFQFEITGSADRVRTSVDKLMKRWRRELRDDDERRLCSLRRDHDGVWCLNLGIDGPAVAVHDGWMIVGPSPAAVRHNIRRLSREPSTVNPRRLSP